MTYTNRGVQQYAPTGNPKCMSQQRQNYSCSHALVLLVSNHRRFFTMLKYPEFFDLRKLAITLAVGPFAFLMLVILIDLSAHLFVTQQTADARCANAYPQKNPTKLQVSECR
ncbi:MAG: hypothetical protein N2235_07710 [Fischerella sp.]|nr:hypothetical protein [Fischerella sp.]